MIPIFSRISTPVAISTNPKPSNNRNKDQGSRCPEPMANTPIAKHAKPPANSNLGMPQSYTRQIQCIKTGLGEPDTDSLGGRQPLTC